MDLEKCVSSFSSGEFLTTFLTIWKILTKSLIREGELTFGLQQLQLS